MNFSTPVRTILANMVMENELQILSRDKSENWSVTFGLFTADTDKGSREKVLNETAILCPTIAKVIREKNFELRRARLNKDSRAQPPLYQGCLPHPAEIRKPAGRNRVAEYTSLGQLTKIRLPSSTCNSIARPLKDALITNIESNPFLHASPVVNHHLDQNCHFHHPPFWVLLDNS